ncbi:LLM class flavin-dependent oxidoreductase [Mammaliicoccus lentus]|uniref:LLM class flavin-dependent oxidoreductase n=1 Tax=Mammaliicoccus lentus TaxID=42858 RepID=UPI000CD291F4|nr:LLM class flavin-dependent oxidoreductase [Mammaliicoccus lentus]POA03735.1 nitrilotriacetate monooxygenase [Mammaliicoccus lentus]WQK50209.1 LLM class flavin-dependent oxidoreductase [Mammaliicoccus lentus]SUM50686.1 monooxygenase [Mammaliicoccus lentus]HBV04369.1 FMN-dependent monooxygenase [Staphylococcus sp.]
MERMKLGYFLTGFGHHVASSRHPESVERGGMNLKKTIEQAKSLEQAKFDFLFVSDSLYVDKKTHPDMFTMFEPISLMSIIAMETKHLGLIITGSTTYSEPFNLSRIFSSLDHYSDGRAGWNIVTSGINDTAKNFSGVNNVDHDLRYDQANEFVEISKKLWNSWRDVDSQSIHKAGKFLKNQQPEPINYEGDFYNVKGPLNIDQSPQGYPLLVQAGSSKKGTDFASKHAEVIFTAQNDIDAAINFAQKLRRQVKEKRGPEQEVVIMPGIFPFIGETREEAQANYKELQDLIDPEMGLELLSSYLGDTDLSGYDLNTPFEDVEVDKGNNIQSRVDLIKETAKRNNSTLEDVMKHVAGARGHHIIVGAPEDVADRMEEWFKRGAADGFNIMPPLNPTQFELFVNKVVPILKERGLVQTDYNEGTLREKLGLSNVKTHS